MNKHFDYSARNDSQGIKKQNCIDKIKKLIDFARTNRSIVIVFDIDGVIVPRRPYILKYLGCAYSPWRKNGEQDGRYIKGYQSDSIALQKMIPDIATDSVAVLSTCLSKMERKHKEKMLQRYFPNIKVFWVSTSNRQKRKILERERHRTGKTYVMIDDNIKIINELRSCGIPCLWFHKSE